MSGRRRQPPWVKVTAPEEMPLRYQRPELAERRAEIVRAWMVICEVFTWWNAFSNPDETNADLDVVMLAAAQAIPSLRSELEDDDEEFEIAFSWVWVGATWIGRLDLDLDERDLWTGPPILPVADRDRSDASGADAKRLRPPS
jgi:hypothetical protein